MSIYDDRVREWRMEAEGRKAENALIVRYIRKHAADSAALRELADAIEKMAHYHEAAEDDQIGF